MGDLQAIHPETVLLVLRQQFRLSAAGAEYRQVLRLQPGQGDCHGFRIQVQAGKTAVQFLRCFQRCAAAAAQIHHQVSGIGHREQQPLQQLQRFLGRISGPFRIPLLQMADIVPDVPGINRLVVIIAVFLAVGGDIGEEPALLIPAAGHMIPLSVPAGQRHPGQIKEIVFGFGVEENDVMLAGEVLLRPAAAFIAPDNLIEEACFAELPVAHQPGRRGHAPVQVEIKDTRIIQQGLRDGNHPPEQAQVLFFTGVPVLVGRIARRGRSCLPALLAVRPAAHELLPGHKGRIHIDALCLSGQRPDLIRQLHHTAAYQQVFTVSVYFPFRLHLFKHALAPPVPSSTQKPFTSTTVVISDSETPFAGFSVLPVLPPAHPGTAPAPRFAPAVHRLPGPRQ